MFHFNCSHGSHEEHQKHYDIVRAIENETGRPIAVLADLQGPKLRVGRLVDAPITLDEGERVRFDLDPAPGTHDRIPLPYQEVFAALAPGVHLLIDDDKMRLEVEEAAKDSAVALEGSPGILGDCRRHGWDRRCRRSGRRDRHARHTGSGQRHAD